jgi:hypothetical protein
MREEVAIIFGYATGKLFGGDGEIGAAVAWNGTAFNWLTHEQKKEYAEEIENVTTVEERDAINEKWEKINDEQNDKWLDSQEAGTYVDPFSDRFTVILPPYEVTSSASWADRALSFSTNLIGTRLNAIGGYVASEYDITLAKGASKVGVVGAMFTLPVNYLTESQKYSGDDLQKAMQIDAQNTFNALSYSTMEVFARKNFIKHRLMGRKGAALDFTAAILIGMHYDEMARQEKEKAGLKTDREKEKERIEQDGR